MRQQITAVNAELPEDLIHFFKISKQIGQEKDKRGLSHFDPVRESQMLVDVQKLNNGRISQVNSTYFQHA